MTEDRTDVQVRRSRRMTRDMALRDFLSVPYLLQAETVELDPGRWVRRAGYPELPGCTAQAPTIEETLVLLERRRIETIVALLQAGAEPPVPRPLLTDCDPEGLMQRVGLHGAFARFLDHTPSRMRAGGTSGDQPEANPR